MVSRVPSLGARLSDCDDVLHSICAHLDLRSLCIAVNRVSARWRRAAARDARWQTIQQRLSVLGAAPAGWPRWFPPPPPGDHVFAGARRALHRQAWLHTALPVGLSYLTAALGGCLSDFDVPKRTRYYPAPLWARAHVHLQDRLFTVCAWRGVAAAALKLVVFTGAAGVCGALFGDDARGDAIMDIPWTDAGSTAAVLACCLAAVVSSAHDPAPLPLWCTPSACAAAAAALAARFVMEGILFEGAGSTLAAGCLRVAAALLPYSVHWVVACALSMCLVGRQCVEDALGMGGHTDTPHAHGIGAVAMLSVACLPAAAFLLRLLRLSPELALAEAVGHVPVMESGTLWDISRRAVAAGLTVCSAARAFGRPAASAAGCQVVEAAAAVVRGGYPLLRAMVLVVGATFPLSPHARLGVFCVTPAAEGLRLYMAWRAARRGTLSVYHCTTCEVTWGLAPAFQCYKPACRAASRPHRISHLAAYPPKA